MDDTYLLALGFERWVSAFPLQTAMYVYSFPALDGARLYLSLPAPRRGISSDLNAADREWLATAVDAFFAKHGGKHQLRPAERASLAF